MSSHLYNKGELPRENTYDGYERSSLERQIPSSRRDLQSVIQQLADRGDARAARVLTELDASPGVTVLIAAEGTLVAVPLAELEATLMP